MQLVWRLVKTALGDHKTALFTRFLIAAAVAASPYAFSFLGKWLIDDALQVTGPPKPKPAAAQPAAKATGKTPLPGKPGASSPLATWSAKTPEEKLRLLAIFFGVSIAIHVVMTGLSALSELLNSRMVNEMVCDLRSAVHEKLSALDLAVFSREQVGQLMTRVLDDAGGIPGNLTNLVINTATQVAMLVLGLYLLLSLNVTMTIIALATLPFYAISCIIFLPRIKRNAEELRVRGAAFNGFVVERLTNIATVKNYAQEDREVATFSRTLDDNLSLSRAQNRLNLVFGTLTTLVTAFGTLGVLAYGFLSIKAEKMQLGEVLAFYQVTAQLFVPIAALVGMGTVVQTLQVLGQRVYSILDTPSTIQDAADAIDLEEIKGEVSFENVSLRYEEGGPFAVSNVNLAVPAGRTVCIVGPTGCGKSTLLILLNRLYDATDGVIRIDGVDVRKIPIKTLRHAIGNVLHDCQVFSGTVAENISYGAPDASQEEIESAARLVDLHDSIRAQPEGYETKLGRGGLSLSAEQLTKLSLARALVTKPAVLTVDDTYSAIEEDVEKRLRAAVRTALEDHTILIATSRLSICEDADVVVVMQNGRIAQVGAHGELLAVPGLYRRMYMRAMGMAALDANTTT